MSFQIRFVYAETQQILIGGMKKIKNFMEYIFQKVWSFSSSDFDFTYHEYTVFVGGEW